MNAFAMAISRPFAAVGQATVSGLERLAAGVRWAGSSWGWTVLLNRTRINYAAEVGDPTKNSMVVAIVGWIARNFPEAPVRITVRGADGMRVAIRRGPTGAGRMLALLERPNRYFSGALMWMAVIVDFYTTGNAYIYKVRAASGAVIELWWIPKRFIRPNWPADGSAFIGWYEYTVDGIVYELREEDIIHLRDGIDPENPRLGLSKLASLFREIYTDDEASNFTAALLTNLGVPGVILAPANTTANVKADPEAVKKKFTETFGGDNRGGVMALSSPTEVKVLSWSPEQMNLRELRRIPEERASAVLGVPAAVVGLGSGLDQQAFTSYRDARIAAYEETVIPDHRLVAGELEVQLLPDFVDLEEIARLEMDVDFDISNVRALQESIDLVWRRADASATKGLITRAAFKRLTNQPVAADGSDDVYILPTNYVVFPAGEPQPPATRRAGGQFPPAGVTGLLAPLEPLPQLGPGAEPEALRCHGCDRLLAEQATRPYRITCSRCRAVNEAA